MKLKELLEIIYPKIYLLLEKEIFYNHKLKSIYTNNIFNNSIQAFNGKIPYIQRRILNHYLVRITRHNNFNFKRNHQLL